MPYLWLSNTLFYNLYQVVMVNKVELYSRHHNAILKLLPEITDKQSSILFVTIPPPSHFSEDGISKWYGVTSLV